MGSMKPDYRRYVHGQRETPTSLQRSRTFIHPASPPSKDQRRRPLYVQRETRRYAKPYHQDHASQLFGFQPRCSGGSYYLNETETQHAVKAHYEAIRRRASFRDMSKEQRRYAALARQGCRRASLKPSLTKSSKASDKTSRTPDSAASARMTNEGQGSTQVAMCHPSSSGSIAYSGQCFPSGTCVPPGCHYVHVEGAADDHDDRKPPNGDERHLFNAAASDSYLEPIEAMNIGADTPPPLVDRSQCHSPPSSANPSRSLETAGNSWVHRRASPIASAFDEHTKRSSGPARRSASPKITPFQNDDVSREGKQCEDRRLMDYGQAPQPDNGIACLAAAADVLEQNAGGVSNHPAALPALEKIRRVSTSREEQTLGSIKRQLSLPSSETFLSDSLNSSGEKAVRLPVSKTPAEDGMSERRSSCVQTSPARESNDILKLVQAVRQTTLEDPPDALLLALKILESYQLTSPQKDARSGPQVERQTRENEPTATSRTFFARRSSSMESERHRAATTLDKV